MIWLDNLFPWFGQMIDLGGDILLLIIVLAAFLWALILERLLYIFTRFRGQLDQVERLWQNRPERRSWFAQQSRRFYLHKANQALQKNVQLMKTLIKLCPLLGLLGTVIGMLEIFDAVAITGGNNPRATAGGVSKAIITTMAGMVVAISALPIVGYLNRKIVECKERMSERLPLDG